MSAQTLTLNVPEPLHRWLKDRATKSRRSVEEETLDVLGAAVPEVASIPLDLTQAVTSLSLLDDEALWRAARSGLAADAAGQLEDLQLKRQREGLTAEQEQARAALVGQYERAMLIRAEAAVQLRRRGHDVSALLGQ